MDVKCDVQKITLDLQLKLTELFRTHEDWDDIFNVLLVFTCVRRAYFADQMTKEQKKLIKSVIKICNSSKLKPKLKLRNIKGLNIVYLDPEIDKLKEIDVDAQLGGLLGFHCIGHDYNNIELHRLGLRINVENKNRMTMPARTFNPYAEFCVVDEKNAKKQREEVEQFIKFKSAQYQKVADLFGFTVTYEIQNVAGKWERVQNLKNNNYIKDHFDEYYNDLANYFTPNTRFADLDMNYDAIVETGLLELFKFEHMTSTGLELYEELREFMQMSEEEQRKLTKEQRQALAEGPDKLLRDFEFDLMTQKDLLKLPYKKWLDSPILKDLVRVKYPELVPLFV